MSPTPKDDAAKDNAGFSTEQGDCVRGSPRKFNTACDGGAALGVVADTTDLGFVAARVNQSQAGVA